MGLREDMRNACAKNFAIDSTPLHVRTVCTGRVVITQAHLNEADQATGPNATQQEKDNFMIGEANIGCHSTCDCTGAAEFTKDRTAISSTCTTDPTAHQLGPKL
jgi:hypothetical protein